MFPRVHAANLERRNFVLPDDLEGERNLVLIAFQRDQQFEIDTWIPVARRQMQQYPDFRYYELPTISRRIPFARQWLDEAMRAGIPNRVAREATITLYLDKAAFRRALQLPREDTIYALVVDRMGHVLWRAEGPCTDVKAQSLERALAERGSAGAP